MLRVQRKLCAVHTAQSRCGGKQTYGHDFCDLGEDLQWESQVCTEGIRLPVAVELYGALWNAVLESKHSTTTTKAVRRVLG